jgi:hypothetical protein
MLIAANSVHPRRLTAAPSRRPDGVVRQGRYPSGLLPY